MKEHFMEMGNVGKGPEEAGNTKQETGAEGMEELKAKCDEFLLGWKRAQADYANLQKEMERGKAEYAKYANERLLSSLLPAIDQYEIALNFVPDLSTIAAEDKKRIENWIVGIKAVRSLWENAFQEIGLEKSPATGTFDPLLHEAVGEEESDKPENEIVRVAQEGWRLNGKLLRPAKVILSKKST